MKIEFKKARIYAEILAKIRALLPNGFRTI